MLSELTLFKAWGLLLEGLKCLFFTPCFLLDLWWLSTIHWLVFLDLLDWINHKHLIFKSILKHPLYVDISISHLSLPLLIACQRILSISTFFICCCFRISEVQLFQDNLVWRFYILARHPAHGILSNEFICALCTLVHRLNVSLT